MFYIAHSHSGMINWDHDSNCQLHLCLIRQLCPFFDITYVQIGQYIASNGGVVTAEELAPYLDLETSEKMVIIFFLGS